MWIGPNPQSPYIFLKKINLIYYLVFFNCLYNLKKKI